MMPYRSGIRVLLAGGGTGGHVYPAIAIAHAVQSRRPTAEIAFAGSRDRMEWQAVPKAGFPIHEIAVQGLQRALTLKNARLPFTVTKGLMQAWSLIKHFDAHVVVGTGGYVALPVLLAARGRGVPTLIQEQNAYVGLTNRIAARFADRIHVAFQEAADRLPDGVAKVTGNPVRAELADVAVRDRAEARAALGFEAAAGAGGSAEGADHGQMVFVFGGSLGSLALNRAMERVVADLLRRPGLCVYWQTGRNYHADIVERLGDRMAGRLRVVPYVDDMATVYAAADVVVCRSGALTCSELMLTGRPSLLVPSPNVTEDHQTLNARSLQQAGAAEVLREADLEATLVDRLFSLLDNPAGLRRMSAAARSLARPTAAADIAADVIQLAEARS
ncbi:MAG: undecaprenyldiphospho-muramoylpentapeptide beta-N-acetylglucosaminyltransferase [Rhodothermales bacterium]